MPFDTKNIRGNMSLLDMTCSNKRLFTSWGDKQKFWSTCIFHSKARGKLTGSVL